MPPTPTECSQDSTAAFDGGAIASNAGALRLREVDRGISLSRQVAACFKDGRRRDRIEHCRNAGRAAHSWHCPWLRVGYHGGRVHPPLPAPYPAKGFSPHPPLRSLRQYRPRRQYRAAARTARLCAATCGEGGRSQSRRTGRDDLAALFLLRRAHDRHRVFRTRYAAALPAALHRPHLVRHVMSCDPLLRRVTPSSVAGLSAALPDRCLQSAPSGASAQLYCLLNHTFQSATASTGPAEAKITRKLLAAVATLPLKSP